VDCSVRDQIAVLHVAEYIVTRQCTVKYVAGFSVTGKVR